MCTKQTFTPVSRSVTQYYSDLDNAFESVEIVTLRCNFVFNIEQKCVLFIFPGFETLHRPCVELKAKHTPKREPFA